MVNGKVIVESNTSPDTIQFFFGIDGGCCCLSFKYGCGGSYGGQNGAIFKQEVGGLARYSVHLTATAQEKLLRDFLFMLDPHPQTQNDRNGPSFPMVQVASSRFLLFTYKIWCLSKKSRQNGLFWVQRNTVDKVHMHITPRISKVLIKSFLCGKFIPFISKSIQI